MGQLMKLMIKKEKSLWVFGFGSENEMGFLYFEDICDVAGLSDVSSPPWLWTEAAMVQRRGKLRERERVIFSHFLGKENLWNPVGKILFFFKFLWLGMELFTWRPHDRWSRLWTIQQHPSWYRNSCHPPFVSTNPSLSSRWSGTYFCLYLLNYITHLLKLYSYF